MDTATRHARSGRRSFLSCRGQRLELRHRLPPQGEPPTLHDKALVLAKGQERPLEVWRDHDRRLKRVTGDDLEVYATKSPGQTEFSLSILDKKKRIHTRIDRSNLYRIGNFADWFDLEHGLRHPAGPHRIAQTHAPKDAPQAAVPCTWYAITQDPRTTHVCWSTDYRIPALIVAEDGRVLWKLIAADRKPIPAGTFDIHDEGFVRNDANRDIEND